MEHVTRTQEIMNLLSLAPEIQEEMSRPRSWAADNGAAAQDLLSMSFRKHGEHVPPPGQLWSAPESTAVRIERVPRRY